MITKAQWVKLLLWCSLMIGATVFVPADADNLFVNAGNVEAGDVDADVEKQPVEEKGKGVFRVNEVTTQLNEDVYRLNARLEYHLSNAVLEALGSGVAITFELQLKVISPREWIWDKTVAELSQQYRIEYYALTRQYLVTNLNSQSQDIYSNEADALEALGVISQLPLIDKHLLREGEPYEGRLRIRLMIEELPAPLRVLAYLSSEWRLSSEWAVWQLQ